jgi:hypothetical protein
MKATSLLAALLLSSNVALVHAAAPAPYLTIDLSTETLISATTAQSMWKEHQSSKLVQLYPSKKWGFTSQVEGGFTDGKICVVTARAMILPRAGKNLTFKPVKTATTFAAQPGATTPQCQALAKQKLHEAMDALASALVAS